MSETEEKLMTVNEYAAENHVSRQSVNSKINRHKDELKGHVFIINGRKMLDGFAQDFLKPTKDNALLKVSVTALCIGNAQAVAVFLKITAEAFNLWLLRI